RAVAVRTWIPAHPDQWLPARPFAACSEASRTGTLVAGPMEGTDTFARPAGPGREEGGGGGPGRAGAAELFALAAARVSGVRVESCSWIAWRSRLSSGFRRRKSPVTAWALSSALKRA